MSTVSTGVVLLYGSGSMGGSYGYWSDSSGDGYFVDGEYFGSNLVLMGLVPMMAPMVIGLMSFTEIT